MTKRQSPLGLNALLHGDQIRRLEREGKTFYAAVDAVAVLTGTGDAAGAWNDLKAREPILAKAVLATPGDEAAPPTEWLDLAGLLRLVQAVPSPRAEKLKAWLVQAAVERLEEAENPELAVLRTRNLYESKGYSRRWVDQRLRGTSARHELTGEWYKRGATASDQFRGLTNTLMERGFGMDVEAYRRHKGLFKTGEALRDHMSDLELALTALGETAAVALHRVRDSRAFDDLLGDAADAGEVVARTRSELERRLGHPVVEAANHGGRWAGRRRTARPRPGADAAERVDSPDAPAVEGDPAPRPPTPDIPGKAVV